MSRKKHSTMSNHFLEAEGVHSLSMTLVTESKETSLTDTVDDVQDVVAFLRGLARQIEKEQDGLETVKILSIRTTTITKEEGKVPTHNDWHIPR